MKNCILIHNDQRKPFIVRLVFPGEGCGRWIKEEQKWAMTNDAKEPTLAFFVPTHPETPYGYFTGASYHLSTLTESRSQTGLLLDGGNPEWSIDANTMKQVLEWACQVTNPEMSRNLYAVTGRVAGDDDDTLFVVEAPDSTKAFDAAREQLWEERRLPKNDCTVEAFMISEKLIATEYGHNTEFAITKSPFAAYPTETQSENSPPRERG